MTSMAISPELIPAGALFLLLLKSLSSLLVGKPRAPLLPRALGGWLPSRVFRMLGGLLLILLPVEGIPSVAVPKTTSLNGAAVFLMITIIIINEAGGIALPRSTAVTIASGTGVTIASLTGVLTPLMETGVRTITLYVSKHWPSWLSGGIGVLIGVLLSVIMLLVYELYSVLQEQKAGNDNMMGAVSGGKGSGRKKQQPKVTTGVTMELPHLPMAHQAFSHISPDALVQTLAASAGTARLEIESCFCEICGSQMRLGSERDAPVLYFRCKKYRTGAGHCDGRKDVGVETTTVIRCIPTPVAG